MSLWRKNQTKTDDPDFIKYKLKDLRFFARDEWFFGRDSANRIYRRVFTRAELDSHGLFAELSLYNKLYDEQDWSCKIRFVVDKLKADDVSVERHLIDDEFSRVISKSTNLELVGRGKKEDGFWKDGTYVWRAYIDDVKVVENHFYVYDLPHPDSADNAFFSLEGVSLFESAQSETNVSPQNQLIQFKAGETRFVNIRTVLRNKLNFNWHCELFLYFLKETGDLKSAVYRFQPLKTGVQNWDTGRGNDNGQFWTAGRYKINVVFMDRLIASVPFVVGDEFITGDVSVLKPGETKSDSPETEAVAETVEKTPEELLKELDALIGMNHIKEQINDYVGYLKFSKHRNQLGIEYEEKISLHAVLSGNPGTGKTTIAKLLGGIYKSLGLLSKGHVHEVDRSDLVGEYVGQTAPRVKKAIESARGGILFIDEAYSLTRSGNDSKDFGPEVIEILLKEMSDGPGDLAVLAAGYPEEMKRFMESNPGLKSRFGTVFNFPDYSPEELLKIAESAIKKRHLTAEADALEYLFTEFTRAYRDRDKSFGNARFAISAVDEAKMNMALRLVKNPNYTQLTLTELSMLKKEDVADVFAHTKPTPGDLSIDKTLLDEALTELDALIGLQSVKQNVQEMVKLVKYYRESGRNVLNQFAMHALYVGNPGTGKTTVARIMAKIFRALGVIERGHLVECDRAALVAGYVGQTAIRTSEMIEKSLGGVLFIDEAYALNQGSDDQFGKEAVNTLLKRMEDLRDEFIVIAAGYPENMREFLNSNPGLRSRFEHYFVFEDYNADELYQIGLSMLMKEKLIPDEQTAILLKNHFRDMLAKKEETFFGNARDVRKVIQQAVRAQHLRMASYLPEQRTPELMETLTVDDVNDLSRNISSSKESPSIGFKR